MPLSIRCRTSKAPACDGYEAGADHQLGQARQQRSSLKTLHFPPIASGLRSWIRAGIPYLFRARAPVQRALDERGCRRIRGPKVANEKLTNFPT